MLFNSTSLILSIFLLNIYRTELCQPETSLIHVPATSSSNESVITMSKDGEMELLELDVSLTIICPVLFRARSDRVMLEKQSNNALSNELLAICEARKPYQGTNHTQSYICMCSPDMQ